MKTTIRLSIIALTVMTIVMSACTNDWNDHYSQKEQIVKNENVAISPLKAVEFLQQETSLSGMNALFQETGIDASIEKSAQMYTVLVVNNDVPLNIMAERKEYVAKSHIAPVALSPSYIYNGMRILMLNGKYINVTIQEDAEGIVDIFFNDIKVKHITKVADGYVYELETYIDSPQSMYEMIKELDDNYSIFRDLILSKVTWIFDKSASMPIGVDETGNTVYDSVKVESFPYFAAQNFDLSSESLTATMLIPSNEILTTALNQAYDYLSDCNLQREDSVIRNWIFQVCFFNKKYTKSDFENNEDLTSVFSRQWRTTIQQANLDNPITMSNGLAYYITYMKIPVNVLIYRIKNFFYPHEYMSAEEKAIYFVTEGLVFKEYKTEVTPWSGWPQGGWPEIFNRVLRFNLAPSAADSTVKVKNCTLDFTAFSWTDNGDGTYNFSPLGIPPGEYELSLGFVQQKSGNPGDMGIFFQGDSVGVVTVAQIAGTDFHYDRSRRGYPEGYDTSKATDSKKTYYDCDGGLVATVTLTGTEPKPIKIKFHGYNNDRGDQAFHHWCLRPTKNCY